MITHQGIYLPDGEKHLVEWMTLNGEIVNGRGTYQIKKLREALRYCRKFGTAVDVGAHCGFWSMRLAERFAKVHAFEPVEAHRECFRKNIFEGPVLPAEVILHHCALGEQAGRVAIRTAPTSSGDSWVDQEQQGDIRLARLDDELPDEVVDFVKLDCEGYELFALRGGEELLRRSRPCVIVEQKPGRAQKFGLGERDAVDYLKSLGATFRKEMAGDFILSWD